MSRLDQFYRRLLISKFFTKGWGKPDNLKRLFEFRKILSDRDVCQHLVPPDYPIYTDKDVILADHRLIEGHFQSPFTKYVQGIMPEEVEVAQFQMILPKKWKQNVKPVCLHLAGTGDHYFWRRRTLMAKPLLKEAGIASIILENPYYGVRKPKSQVRSCLNNVSDLFVMGGALVLESLALFHWCERQGWGPLGITGISMGGHMASLAATNWFQPIAVVPCLSWSTASHVFTQGVLSGAIPWEVLQSQYYEDSVYEDEIRKLIQSPEDDQKAYLLGQNFAKHYPESMDEMQKIQNHHFQENDGCSMMYAGISDSGRSSNPKKNITSSENLELTAMDESQGLQKKANTTYLSQGQSRGKKTQSGYLTLCYALAKSNLLRSAKPKPQNIVASASLRKEALEFMRGVMDECTHIGNFSQPVDTSLIIIVAAKQDAYIPREGILSLEQLWPGSEVRYIDSGHIAAFLFSQNFFRKAIKDAFERQIKKYYR